MELLISCLMKESLPGSSGCDPFGSFICDLFKGDFSDLYFGGSGWVTGKELVHNNWPCDHRYTGGAML